MSRKIIEGDVKRIKELALKVIGTDNFIALERMGGLTNHTYKVVTADGKAYVVRLPGEGTEKMINRGDEEKSTRLACEIGVDAKLLYFGADGSKVSEYIENAVTMSAHTLKNSEHIEQIADIFKTIHNCGKDTGVPFEVFEMAESYENIIEEHGVPMFEDYLEIKQSVMRIKEETDRTQTVKKVPCHNDPLCENWVEGNGRMYLIDWEYAGMNDGMWDLADVSIEAGFDETCDMLLLCKYFGKEPSLAQIKHFVASKIYVDYLWTLWAKTRVPFDGQPMDDWAHERYTRLASFIKIYTEL